MTGVWLGNGGVRSDREGNFSPPVVTCNCRQKTVGLGYSRLLQVMEQCCEFPVLIIGPSCYTFL